MPYKHTKQDTMLTFISTQNITDATMYNIFLKLNALEDEIRFDYLLLWFHVGFNLSEAASLCV